MSEQASGELTFVLEFGSGLQNRDLFGKQDPYCILKCGTLTRRSQVCVKGGKDPAWNEQFAFALGPTENEVSLQVFDKDKLKVDDAIGTGVVHLARARYSGKDSQQVPLITHKGKQQGFVQVSLTFVKNQKLQDVTATYGTTAYRPPASIYVGLHSTPSSTAASTPSLFSSMPASPWSGATSSPYAQPNPYGQPGPYGAPSGYPAINGALQPFASFPPPFHPPPGYPPGSLHAYASYPPAVHGDPALQAPTAFSPSSKAAPQAPYPGAIPA